MKPTSLPSIRTRFITLLTLTGTLLSLGAEEFSYKPSQAALALQQTNVDLARHLRPSVVCVTAYVPQEPLPASATDEEKQAWRNTGTDSVYDGYRQHASGSGFFIDREGHLLCCRHTLMTAGGKMARVIDVETTTDGRRTLCRVIGSEPTLNFALLKLEVYPDARPPDFTVPAFAKSEDVKPGELAFALGDPGGPLRIFATGVFASRPERQCYQNDLTSTFIQASLSLHPETNGGPLVNLKGEVVGLLTPRHPQGSKGATDLPGVALAMPITIIRNIADALKVKGSGQSPWLGFSVLEIAAVRAKLRQDPKALRNLVAPRTGIYIDDVYDPSPASTIGIEAGDYLTSINGSRLFSVLDFQKQLYLAGIGNEIELKIFREGETKTLKAKVEARPTKAITH
ncbi:MAG: S1C family serine protease [Verrucomicrobiota bacterium]